MYSSVFGRRFLARKCRSLILVEEPIPTTSQQDREINACIIKMYA